MIIVEINTPIAMPILIALQTGSVTTGRSRGVSSVLWTVRGQCCFFAVDMSVLTVRTVRAEIQ
jgi:hypothetical protein